MNTFFKKLIFLAGGAAALIGFGSHPAQAFPADSMAKFEGVTEKTQLVLTQASYAAGKDLSIQSHYSHSSHQSHQSHHSHYSSRS